MMEFICGFISGIIFLIVLIILIVRCGNGDDDDYYASGPYRGMKK